MNIDFSILMALIAFSAFVAVLGFWMQRKDEQTIIPALSLFVSASLFFFLFASIDTVSNTYFSSGLTDNLYSYNVESRNSGTSLSGAGAFALSEFVSSSSSQLLGDTINCIDLYMNKVNAPTGTVEVGTLDSSANIITSFGTMNVVNVALSSTWYTFCLSGDNTYTIQNGDRLGVRFTGGDATNTLNVNIDNNNPFDGTITFRQGYSVSWVSSTTSDHTMRLYLSGGEFEITGNTIDMSELKYYFLVIATFLMLTAVYSVKLYKGQGSGEYIDSL